MALPPERPLADPLLAPDAGPRDATGAPVRAPIGNSIKTLLLLGALVVVGVAIWWIRRPVDLTDRIGGREWAIVEIDGEPATNSLGRVSSVVLDGTHEIRGIDACNSVTGRWDFDTADQRLVVDWQTTTLVRCSSDWPATFTIGSGEARLEGDVLVVDEGDRSIRAVVLAEHPVASADELAGVWESGGSTIEIGPRGLIRIDDCPGSWVPSGDGIMFRWDEPGDCELDRIWTDGGVVLPVRFEDSLFLRRDVTSFPVDREVHRLDVTASPGS